MQAEGRGRLMEQSEDRVSNGQVMVISMNFRLEALLLEVISKIKK